MSLDPISIYSNCYTNFNWETQDFSEIKKLYTDEIETLLEKTSERVLESESTVDDLASWYDLDVLSVFNKFALEKGLPNLIEKASSEEKFLMVKLIEKVTPQSEFEKTTLVASCLFFGMKEINTLALKIRHLA